MLEELSAQNKIVGVRQSRKAVLAGCARCVYLAVDADPDITLAIAQLCSQQGIETIARYTGAQLGAAAGIAVAASAVTVCE